MRNLKKHAEIERPGHVCELCGTTSEDTLELHSTEDILITLKEKMTAMELIHTIEALSKTASELTVALARACGICNNCGDKNPEPCESCDGSKACAFLNGCKDGPIEWVANCSLCRDLLDDSQDVRIPDYVLEDAGISKNAKLEAYSFSGTVKSSSPAAGISALAPTTPSPSGGTNGMITPPRAVAMPLISCATSMG